MKLIFEEATALDIPELTRVMTLAFDDDSRRHLGIDKGGPPGYDNGDFFRKWMLGYKESIGYKVLLDGRVIGGMIVWILPDANNILGTVFLDPAYQNQGIGLRMWQFVEQTYPQTKSWRLETPAFAVKNHFLYEHKCGFTKIEEKQEPDGVSFVYQKLMHPTGQPT